MCYPVCGMVYVKHPLPLLKKHIQNVVAASGSLWQSLWSFTLCLTPHNRKQNVLSVSLNK